MLLLEVMNLYLFGWLGASAQQQQRNHSNTEREKNTRRDVKTGLLWRARTSHSLQQRQPIERALHLTRARSVLSVTVRYSLHAGDIAATYHFQSFLRSQQVKHGLQMLLNVTAHAANRRLAGRQLLRDLAEAAAIGDAPQAFIRAQHQRCSFTSKVAFAQTRIEMNKK